MYNIDIARAAFILSFVCMLGQISNSQEQPNSNPQTQYDQRVNGTNAKSKETHTIPGCPSGAADVFLVTDVKGKTYYLVGPFKRSERSKDSTSVEITCAPGYRDSQVAAPDKEKPDDDQEKSRQLKIKEQEEQWLYEVQNIVSG